MHHNADFGRICDKMSYNVCSNETVRGTHLPGKFKAAQDASEVCSGTWLRVEESGVK